MIVLVLALCSYVLSLECFYHSKGLLWFKIISQAIQFILYSKLSHIQKLTDKWA